MTQKHQFSFWCGGKVGTSPGAAGPQRPLGPLGPPGTPGGTPTTLETPSNLRNPLEPLWTPIIFLGPRKDFTRRPMLRLIKPGDITKEF